MVMVNATNADSALITDAKNKNQNAPVVTILGVFALFAHEENIIVLHRNLFVMSARICIIDSSRAPPRKLRFCLHFARCPFLLRVSPSACLRPCMIQN